MKIGISVVEEVTLYKVEIEGRGGDNVRTVTYHTNEAAVMASAIDGKNRTPRGFRALKFSDGSYGNVQLYRIDPGPTPEEIAKLKEKLGQERKIKTPAEALLFPDK